MKRMRHTKDMKSTTAITFHDISKMPADAIAARAIETAEWASDLEALDGWTTEMAIDWMTQQEAGRFTRGAVKRLLSIGRAA